MALRRDVEQRRLTMLHDLRNACRVGEYLPGRLAPSVSELTQRYSVSRTVAHQVVRQLIDEGVLHSQPGVGTFVGAPPTTTSEFYLFLQSTREESTDLESGFAERIAQLGGATLALPYATAVSYQERGELPVLAGVWDSGYTDPKWLAEVGIDPTNQRSLDTSGIPLVGFAGHIRYPDRSDAVSFDDVDGGRQATDHLIRLGHRRIAYLGIHDPERRINPSFWSVDRETGWRNALLSQGLSPESLAFHPPGEIPLVYTTETLIYHAQAAAHSLIFRPDITAVVAVNDYAAIGLFAALRAAAIPLSRWPAVVGFDNLPQVDGSIITSLDLPKGEIGRAAATLLWERRNGQRSGPPVHYRVPMRLLPRMTSQIGWSVIMESAAMGFSKA